MALSGHVVGLLKEYMRDLVVQAGRTLVRFDVPPTCVISLRNDRIRLRMLQPGDHVRIIFAEAADLRQALRIEAQPISPESN